MKSMVEMVVLKIVMMMILMVMMMITMTTMMLYTYFLSTVKHSTPGARAITLAVLLSSLKSRKEKL